MLSILCDAAGIPFVKKSMANVSSEGYRGENLSDVLYALSGEQIIKSIHPKITHPMFTETVRHLPGRAIVFLDELDKIAMNGNSGTTGDVFPCKLQQELLAWFSGETVHGVDMSKYLMVGAGAFSGSFGRKSLYQIIQQRVGGSQSQLKSEQLLENLVDADLIEYGFMPELVGRLTNKALLRAVNEEGLYKILAETESSPVRVVKADFEKMGITLEFDDGALREIARFATTGVGVRGLQSIVNGLVEDYSFDRKRYKGETISFTTDKVRERFDKKAEFTEPDDFEIDWKNPRSIIEYLNLY